MVLSPAATKGRLAKAPARLAEALRIDFAYPALHRAAAADVLGTHATWKGSNGAAE
jgi:hypothetical protein